MSLSLSFTPGSIVDGSGNGLTTMTTSTPVSVTTTVSAQVLAQAESMASQVNVVSYILVVVLILMMIKSSYPLVVLIDTLQYIHMHVYVLALPLPYLFMTVLSALKNINFVFLPPLYVRAEPDTESPYISFQEDTTFLGNCQPFVFFLALFGGTYLLFWLLSNRRLNPFKCFRQKVKAVFKSRMRYSFLHEIFYYTEFYVFFFAVYQFTGANSTMEGATTNLAAAIIVFICYLVWIITITYLGVRYRGRLSAMPKKFQFLVM